MPIAYEDITKMREAIKKVDHSVYMLTNIFFIEYKNKNLRPEKIKQIQRYIVQLSMLIPEVRAYLDLMEIGLFDNVELIVKRFQQIDTYVDATEKNCEELLFDLGLL